MSVIMKQKKITFILPCLIRYRWKVQLIKSRGLVCFRVQFHKTNTYHLVTSMYVNLRQTLVSFASRAHNICSEILVGGSQSQQGNKLIPWIVLGFTKYNKLLEAKRKCWNHHFQCTHWRNSLFRAESKPLGGQLYFLLITSMLTP